VIGRREPVEDLELADAEAVLVLETALQGTGHTRVPVEKVAPGVDDRRLFACVTHCGAHCTQSVQLMQSQSLIRH
jgi:hypothetical protein